MYSYNAFPGFAWYTYQIKYASSIYFKLQLCMYMAAFSGFNPCNNVLIV